MFPPPSNCRTMQAERLIESPDPHVAKRSQIRAASRLFLRREFGVPGHMGTGSNVVRPGTPLVLAG